MPVNQEVGTFVIIQPGNLFCLEGHTESGRVALSTGLSAGVPTGRHWQCVQWSEPDIPGSADTPKYIRLGIPQHYKDSVSFACADAPMGPRYLNFNAQNGNVELAPYAGIPFAGAPLFSGMFWKMTLAGYDAGHEIVTLQCMDETISSPQFLSGNLSDGTIGLSVSDLDTTAQWRWTGFTTPKLTLFESILGPYSALLNAKGEGFAANSKVTISVEGLKISPKQAPVLLGEFTVHSDGTFSTFDVPPPMYVEKTGSVFIIRATDQFGCTASSLFEPGRTIKPIKHRPLPPIFGKHEVGRHE
jgi:hypothetical protein